MRQAADLACLSIGGLYHYFPTKQDLALHGIQYETLYRSCQDFHQQHIALAHEHPQEYFAIYFRYLITAILFARPAVYAATTLGEDISTVLAHSIDALVVEFTRALSPIAPQMSEGRLQTLGRAVRRFALATLFDATSTDEELYNEFDLLIGGALRREQVDADRVPVLARL